MDYRTTVKSSTELFNADEVFILGYMAFAFTLKYLREILLIFTKTTTWNWNGYVYSFQTEAEIDLCVFIITYTKNMRNTVRKRFFHFKIFGTLIM